MKHILDLIVAETDYRNDILQYKHVDLSAILRSTGPPKVPKPDAFPASATNIPELLQLIQSIIGETGLFLARHKAIHYPESEIFMQKGVIRSNCIDCLDRTNSFQYIVGRELIKKQLKALGIIANHVTLKEDCDILEITNELYESVGDALSLQYAGSKAHKRSTSMLTDIFTSAKRYINNAMKDSDKQKRINLFLGLATPHGKSENDEDLLLPLPRPPLDSAKNHIKFKYFLGILLWNSWTECLETYLKKLVTNELLTRTREKLLLYLKSEQTRKDEKPRKFKDFEKIVEEHYDKSYSIILNQSNSMRRPIESPLDEEIKEQKRRSEYQKPAENSQEVPKDDFIEKYLQVCKNMGELVVTPDNKIMRKLEIYDLYSTVVKNPYKPGNKLNIDLST